MFTFDGSRLRITGTIGLDGEESVLDAAVSEDRDRICVLRAVSILCAARFRLIRSGVLRCLPPIRNWMERLLALRRGKRCY